MIPFTVPKPEAKADTMYVCLMSHVSDLGTFREGDRFRGSHEGVRKNPQLFIPDGMSADECLATLQSRFPPRDL